MARTPDQIAAEMIGRQALRIVELTAEIERLQEETARRQPPRRRAAKPAGEGPQ